MRRLLAFLLALLPAAGLAQFGGPSFGVPVNSVTTPGSGSSSTTPAVAFTNVVITNMVFVAKSGNDSTAQANDLSKPALTINKAIDLASVGYTIGVFPGTYLQSSNLWRKSGINFEGYGTPLLVMTNLTNGLDRGWGMFDDRFSDMAVTSVVSGFSFRWNAGLPSVFSGTWLPFNTNTLAWHVQTNPLTRTVINGVRAECASFVIGNAGSYARAGTNYLQLSEGLFDLYMRSNYIAFDEDLMGDDNLESTLAGGYWELGEQHIRAPQWQGKAYSLYASDPGSGTTEYNWHVQVDYLEGKWYANGGTNLKWRTWVTFNELKSTNASLSAGATMEFLGGGSHYIRGQKAGSALSYNLSVSTANSQGIKVWANIDKWSARTKWASLSAGWVTIEGQEFEDLGIIDDGFDIGGGTNFISGLHATLTNTSGNLVSHTGGRNTISGLRLASDAYTNSIVMVRTNNLTLQNCVFKSLGTNFTISTDLNATQHVRLLGCFGTSDITNKVTNSVGPFTISTFVQ